MRKTTRVRTDIWLVRGDVDVLVGVTANYTPCIPGVRTLRNGDPGYPDEPEEIEIIEVDSIVDGVKTELSSDEEELAIEAVSDKMFGLEGGQWKDEES